MPFGMSFLIPEFQRVGVESEIGVADMIERKGEINLESASLVRRKLAVGLR